MSASSKINGIGRNEIFWHENIILQIILFIEEVILVTRIIQKPLRLWQ